MSLHHQAHFSLPEETQRVARAAFPKGTLCLRIGDQLGPLYRDAQFADLFPTRGQPADSPARLGPGLRAPIRRGPLRSSGRRRRPRPHRLEVRLEAGTDRSRLRSHRAERIPFRLVHGQAEQQLLDTLLKMPGTRPDPQSGAGSAPTRRMSWRPSVCSTGWSGSARPCGPR